MSDILNDAPVAVEINHRGGPASVAVVHVASQQVYDVAAIEMHADAEQPGDVTVSLTGTDGQVTTVRVVRMELLGEVVDQAGEIADPAPEAPADSEAAA